VQKGNIAASVSPAGWGLSWTSDSGEPPEIERDGAALVVRQRTSRLLKDRLDLVLTLPEGVEVVELRTGLGKVEAVQLAGRVDLTTGNGATSLRDSKGQADVTTGAGEVTIAGYEGDLQAKTGNGRVRIERLSGRAVLTTGNGRIEVLDGSGRLSATTGAGDLLFTGIGGEVELNTGHGQIEIAAPRSLTVRAATASGGIRVEGGSVSGLRLSSVMGGISCSAALNPGKYELTTTMGGITLELPKDVRARVDAATSFGKVHSDVPLVQVGRSGPMGFGGVRMVGSMGEGEPDVEVSLRTSKGSINLHSRGLNTTNIPTTGEAPPTNAWEGTPPPPPSDAFGFGQPQGAPPMQPPAPPIPPPPPSFNDGPGRAAEHEAGTDKDLASPLGILEAVARGELSPEEADRLLSTR